MLVPLLALVGIGLVTVFSTTFYEGQVAALFWNQAVFYLIAFILFLIVSSLNPKFFKKIWVVWSISIFTILSLILVLIVGTEVYGAQRWIDFGVFSFQPSEVAKLSIVLITAFGLSIRTKKDFAEIFNIYKQKESYKSQIKKIILSENFIRTVSIFIFFAITVVLVIRQKSLGNSILISLIFLTILLVNTKFTAKNLFLFVPLLIGALLGFGAINVENLNILIGFPSDLNIIPILIGLLLIFFICNRYKLNTLLIATIFLLGTTISPLLGFTYNNILEDYQRQRIESFLGDQNDRNLFLNEDFNRQMSMMAVGSGQIFGKGFLQGDLVNSRLLPFAYTDFAFAGFTEQFGFFGSLLILIAYLVLFLKIFLVYRKTQDQFYQLVCIGVLVLIFFNTFQHIAMNMGVTPITGVPLPLISYGGTSILTIFLALGIINSIDLEEDQESEIHDFASSYGFNR